MAFSYDPTQLAENKLYQLRLQIGDTDPDNYIFEDEELEYFMSLYCNPLILQYWVTLAAISKLSSVPGYTLGPYKEDNTQRLGVLNDYLNNIRRTLRGKQIPLTQAPSTKSKFGYDMMSYQNSDNYFNTRGRATWGLWEGWCIGNE